MTKRVCYEELTPKEFTARLREAPIAYLPLGTLEWHGEHLPLGADGLQSRGFFRVLAKRVGGIVLPMLFLGPDICQKRGEEEFYGMDILGYEGQPAQQLTGSAYWVDDTLFTNLLEGILRQLKRAGFRVVVAHGHGPSTKAFQANAAQWEKRYGLKLLTVWREDESDGMGLQTDHAAANETSLMMFFRPELVQMENLDSNPEVWPLAVGGKDPRKFASAQHGQDIVEKQLDRMSSILQELIKQN